MTKIGKAEVEVKLTKSKTMEVLEEILATLKRIEDQGKPVQATNMVFKLADGTLTEEQVAESASNHLYWELRQRGTRLTPSKEAGEEFLRKVYQSNGEPVALEPDPKVTFKCATGRCGCGNSNDG